MTPSWVYRPTRDLWILGGQTQRHSTLGSRVYGPRTHGGVMCLLALSSCPCGTPQVLWTRRVISLLYRHYTEPMALSSHIVGATLGSCGSPGSYPDCTYTLDPRGLGMRSSCSRELAQPLWVGPGHSTPYYSCGEPTAVVALTPAPQKGLEYSCSEYG